MKKNFLSGSLAILISMLAFSCGDDDDPVTILDAGTISGGPFEFVVDGVVDNVSGVTVSGNETADNNTWLITDVDGLILGTPPALSDLEAVNFDGAGAGICFIYHVVYSDGLSGLDVNSNIADISGTFDMSNRIRVTRTGIDAGVISGGPFNFIVDGTADNVSGITVSDNEDATNTGWIITDAQRNILGAPPTMEDLEGVDFDAAGAGTCFIYRITYADGLTGLEQGNNMTDLTGAAFDFSNALATVRENATPPTTFRITLTNTVNYLAVESFNTLDGNQDASPGPNVGDSYSISFKATPGTYLSFATMNAMSNDWFYAPDGDGIALYTGNGDPVTGDVTGQVMKWDSGTEEEDPAGWASLGENQIAHVDDDNTSVRLVESSIIDEIGVSLSYGMDDLFTLTISNRAGAPSGVVITPGLLVVHAQDYPLFIKGRADFAYGLKEIAEDGNPGVLYNWFTETGTQGAPLRLTSSMTPFAPGVAYVFAGSASDPLFVQGEAATSDSGLEKLAEDGGADVAVSYLNGLDNVTAVAADQMAPVGPGGTMTFEVSALPGQKFGFATMFIQSNDWFISFNNDGVELFNEDGTPKSGTDYSIQTYLFDAGTEEDQAIGFGADQAPRQSGPNTGMADDDTSVRRVMEIEDVQFGKGTISSSPGVTARGDERGGYNIITVDIQPI